MRTVHLGAIAALIAMGASTVAQPVFDAPEPRRQRHPRKPVPNDLGPVVDTTKESKRAKRRRLAKQRETA